MSPKSSTRSGLLSPKCSSPQRSLRTSPSRSQLTSPNRKTRHSPRLSPTARARSPPPVPVQSFRGRLTRTANSTAAPFVPLIRKRAKSLPVFPGRVTRTAPAGRRRAGSSAGAGNTARWCPPKVHEPYGVRTLTTPRSAAIRRLLPRLALHRLPHLGLPAPPAPKPSSPASLPAHPESQSSASASADGHVPGFDHFVFGKETLDEQAVSPELLQVPSTDGCCLAQALAPAALLPEPGSDTGSGVPGAPSLRTPKASFRPRLGRHSPPAPPPYPSLDFDRLLAQHNGDADPILEAIRAYAESWTALRSKGAHPRTPAVVDVVHCVAVGLPAGPGGHSPFVARWRRLVPRRVCTRPAAGAEKPGGCFQKSAVDRQADSQVGEETPTAVAVRRLHHRLHAPNLRLTCAAAPRSSPGSPPHTAPPPPPPDPALVRGAAAVQVVGSPLQYAERRSPSPSPSPPKSSAGPLCCS
eukprot:EG_transcript_8755